MILLLTFFGGTLSEDYYPCCPRDEFVAAYNETCAATCQEPECETNFGLDGSDLVFDPESGHTFHVHCSCINSGEQCGYETTFEDTLKPCVAPTSTITILDEITNHEETIQLKDATDASVMAKVLTEDDEGNHYTHFEQVFITLDNQAFFPFLNITTETGRHIVMTHGHAMPVNTCCDYESLKSAEEICDSTEPQKVFIVDDSGNIEEDWIASCEVVNVQGVADVIPHDTMVPVYGENDKCTWNSGSKIIINNIVLSHHNVDNFVHGADVQSQHQFQDAMYDEALLISDYVDLNPLLLGSETSHDFIHALNSIQALSLRCEFDSEFPCSKMFLENWFDKRVWPEGVKEMLISAEKAEEGAFYSTEKPNFANHVKREQEWFHKMKNGSCERQSLPLTTRLVLASMKNLNSLPKSYYDLEM